MNRLALAPRDVLRHSPRLGLLGFAGCASALAIALVKPGAMHGWLSAFVFVSSLPIGLLFLLMLMRLVPGRWRRSFAPAAQAAQDLLPISALAVIPVLVFPASLYPWAQHAQDGFRALYLTPGFFALRSVVFFALLAGIAVLLLGYPSWSRTAAAVGLILFALLDGLASADWVMSLDPRFHSSIFGLYVLSIQATVALTMLILVTNEREGHHGIFGGLLLCALLLWAYLAYMQYLIVWSANLPDGAAWYLRRGATPWSWLGWLAIALHVVAMVLLLFPTVRRNARLLAPLAIAVVIGKALEIGWLVLPESRAPGLATLVALLAVAGFGLIGFSAFAVTIHRRASEATS